MVKATTASAHTAGPWASEKKSTLQGDYVVYSPDGKAIAFIGEENNARLIASAPELLEALEQLLEPAAHLLHKIQGENAAATYAQYIEDAKAAIAKAEGRTL